MFSLRNTFSFLMALIICVCGYGQNHFIFDSIPEPRYSNISKRMVSDIFPVGSKMLFRQKCSNQLDTIVVTGEVVFENPTIYGIRCYQSFVLRDTIMIYEYIEPQKTKDTKHFLSIISQKLALNTEPSYVHKGKQEVSVIYQQSANDKVINYTLNRKKNKVSLEIYYLNTVK